MLNRPKNEEELQKREAIGVIRASRFVRQFIHSRQPITIDTICEIHRQIFKDAWPEIAGAWRTEDIKITDSKHHPPHYSRVPELMRQAGENLAGKLKLLKSTEPFWMIEHELTKSEEEMIDAVVETAAWIHHAITFIHPFRDGNGRTARLASNLILGRFGLIGISIRIEKENKNRYRQALTQIDQARDYEPLKALIYEGLMERYEGVPMFFHKDGK